MRAPDELFKIFRVRGTPTEETWPGVTSLENFHDLSSLPSGHVTGVFDMSDMYGLAKFANAHPVDLPKIVLTITQVISPLKHLLVTCSGTDLGNSWKMSQHVVANTEAPSFRDVIYRL